MIAIERFKETSVRGKLTMFASFDSQEEMLANFTREELKDTSEGNAIPGAYDRDRSWLALPDSVNAKNIAGFLRNGDDEIRSAVSASIDKWQELQQATELSSWENDVAGAFPIMPAFIAGDEYCMRRKVARAGLGPIRIVVDVPSSGGIDGGKMAETAAQIASIVLAVSKSRPVELWTFNGTRPGTSNWEAICWSTRIAVDVVDCGALAMALHPATVRGTYRWAMIDSKSTYLQWCWRLTPGKEREDMIRETMGLDPDDVVIPGQYLRPDEIESFLQRMLKPQDCES